MRQFASGVLLHRDEINLPKGESQRWCCSRTSPTPDVAQLKVLILLSPKIPSRRSVFCDRHPLKRNKERGFALNMSLENHTPVYADCHKILNGFYFNSLKKLTSRLNARVRNNGLGGSSFGR